MEPQDKIKDLYSAVKDKIDDYEQTIHALIGFMNFYRYDDDKKIFKDHVIVFQGWRLEPINEETYSSEAGKTPFVTPDLGILYAPNQGVLVEAKKSFPSDREHWMDTFDQLMSYDNDVVGWPTANEKVDQHDIVLLLDQTRGVAVLRYYQSKEGKEIKFERPFIIIQFNRVDNRNHYYFFQKIYGSLSDKNIEGRLVEGVPVPMDVFVNIYSMIKIYDDKPPIPYLIELIWTNVISLKASEDPKFERLKKNQKLEIMLDLDDIVQDLHQEFTFQVIYPTNSPRQKKIPRRGWIVEACEQLIQLGEAKWLDSEKKKVTIYFRKYEDILDHFIRACSQEKENQAQPKLL